MLMFINASLKFVLCFPVSEMLIRIPGNVPVGQWSVTVATWYGEKSMNESRHDMETFHATASDPFYVLFNPFSESKIRCIFISNPITNSFKIVGNNSENFY